MPFGANTSRARKAVPDRARPPRRARRRHHRQAVDAGSHGLDLEAAPADPGLGAALRLEPAAPQRPACRGLGLWDSAASRYLIPADSATDSTTRAGPAGLAEPLGVLQRRLPLLRAVPDLSQNGGATAVADSVVVARQGAGAGARRRRASGAFHVSVNFGKLARRAHDDRPRQALGGSHVAARWTASSRATSRPSRAPTTRQTCGNPNNCLGELRGRLQPYAIYVPKKPPPPTGLRADAAPALARRQLQPVRGLAKPVAVRQPGPGLDRDHAPRAADPTAGTTARPAPTPSRCGPTSPATTGSIRTGPTSPATRWAATRPTSSRRSTRTSSRRAQPTVGPPGLGIWVPPADPEPGRRRVEHQPDAGVGAQHPVPDLGRDERRARSRPGARRAGADLRRPRLPLRVRPLRAAGRPLPPGGRTTSTRRRRSSSGTAQGRPQPAARHLRGQPDDGLRQGRHRRRPRLLALAT